MNPTPFPQANETFGLHQPQYKTLVACRTKEGEVISRWEPTAEERVLLSQGAPLWLWVLTFGHPLQPVALTLDPPWEDQRFTPPVRRLAYAQELARGLTGEELVELAATVHDQLDHILRMKQAST